MSNLTESLGMVAPLYNLALVVIIVILLVVLLRIKTKVSLTAWKVMLFIVCVYIVEEVLTVLNKFDVIDTPRIITGFLELIMLATFLFMVLKQREEVGKMKNVRR